MDVAMFVWTWAGTVFLFHMVDDAWAGPGDVVFFKLLGIFYYVYFIFQLVLMLEV